VCLDCAQNLQHDDLRACCITCYPAPLEAHPCVVFEYSPTREKKRPEAFLRGWRGYLQADAFPGYDAMYARATHHRLPTELQPLRPLVRPATPRPPRRRRSDTGRPPPSAPPGHGAGPTLATRDGLLPARTLTANSPILPARPPGRNSSALSEKNRYTPQALG